jgi:hypothetical protein
MEFHRLAAPLGAPTVPATETQRPKRSSDYNSCGQGDLHSPDADPSRYSTYRIRFGPECLGQSTAANRKSQLLSDIGPGVTSAHDVSPRAKPPS